MPPATIVYMSATETKDGMTAQELNRRSMHAYKPQLSQATVTV